MTANSIDNFIIVFKDPASTPIVNARRVSSDLSYAQNLTNNIQTLSTTDTDPDGSIQGLLYVPDLPSSDPCSTTPFIPKNATRQSNLPNTDFNLVALAPWISANCTRSFLSSTQSDPIRALIFYLPDNGTTIPPPVGDAVWSLGDGGAWQSTSHYPVFAIPGTIGANMMEQLSLYSGNVTYVPNGTELLTEGIGSSDYVRLYVEIGTSTSSSTPSLWAFLLVIVGALAVIVGAISGMMHCTQRRRRQSLQRRIVSGEVDLEALGIKRLTVPRENIDAMPLYIYTCPNPSSSPPIRTHSMTKETMEPVGRPTTPTSSILAQEYLPQSQPTCPICLDDFQSRITVIRELPCGHIFHPECIDTFLGENSSLCPMCKKGVLPQGYCPTAITNGMVRRERAIRRLRMRVIVGEGEEIGADGGLPTRWERTRNAARWMVGWRPNNDVELEGGRQQQQQQQLQMSRHVITSSVTSQLNRQGVARARAEQLAPTLPELAHLPGERYSTPKWRKAVSKVFPGFS